MFPMNTVGEPRTMGTGVGDGGWNGPAAVAPEQMAPFIM
jgi:hypothetical protein